MKVGHDLLLSSNYKNKIATYDSRSSVTFFITSLELAIQSFKKGISFKKDNTPVIFGTIINQFDNSRDGTLYRTEMNHRGLLRDFISIDFDVDDIEQLRTVIKRCNHFAKEYKTLAIFYPTYSFPQKARGRTIVFTKTLMDKKEYSQAVTFFINYIGINPLDDSNFDIKHNFNIPTFNNQEQVNAIRIYTPTDTNFSRLDNSLWKQTKVKVPINSSTYTDFEIKKRFRNTIHISETFKRDNVKLEQHLKELITEIKLDINPRLNFEYWNNFFRFLHSLARTEIAGSLDRIQIFYILETIALDNETWIWKNKRDYLYAYQQLINNKKTLELAKPLNFYFGITW